MISSQQLGERLADARKRVKLTQAQVAEKLGIARTTLVSIEKGERRATSAELMKLADILATSLHELLRETLVRAEISPRFRLPSLERETPEIAEAVERLRRLGSRYAELEQMHGLKRVRAPLETLQTYRLEPGSSPRIEPRIEGEEAARVVRGMIGLGDDPVVDLDERLETEAGLRIFYLDRLPAKLAAFLIWTDEIGACVAINRAHPRERQRWSLVHEFGHFLRDRELGDILDEDGPARQPGEVFPDAVAKEFLMPAVGVQKRFNERCRAGKFTPVDLHALAMVFGVSFQAMALRLEELRLLPKGSYEKITRSRLRPTDLATDTPPAARHVDPTLLGLPDRYVALAVSAHDQDLLSETELADFLETDVATAREVYQRRRRVPLDDGTWVTVDFAGHDLRIA